VIEENILINVFDLVYVYDDDWYDYLLEEAKEYLKRFDYYDKDYLEV